MGFGVAVSVGVWVLGQAVFASAAFIAPPCIVVPENGSILEANVSEDVLKWAQEGLDAHNKLRKKHGTPPLVLNPKMCKSAQWSANWNAPNTNWNRNPHTQVIEGIGFDGMKCGENMGARGGATLMRANDTAQDWYSEIENYDFVKHAQKPGKIAGHFIQVVWKATKEMCMTYAQAENKSQYWIAAHYYPPAFDGSYAENVLNSNSANHDHFKTGIIFISIICVHFF